jgi:AAA+ ATPase superfamily predicted ATPase
MVDIPIVNNYVSRPLLEGKILQVYESRRKGSDSYTIIVGPRGAGKMSVVAHVLNKKPGVLHVDLTGAATERTVLLKLLRIKSEVLEEHIGLRVLHRYLVQSAEGLNGRRITIVLEVEQGSKSDEILYMVKSAAKKLALSANVIIVLSEPNAALVFGDDLREKFIWVDGMTHEEAIKYAKKVFPAASDGDLKLFFDKVGTLPLDIREFSEALKNGEIAVDYIKAALDATKSDLAAFTHKPILKALKSSPDGVETYKFDGVNDEGVNLAEPKDVAVAMQKSQAIVYHPLSGEYRLATKAHRTVLVEQYDPPIVLNTQCH